MENSYYFLLLFFVRFIVFFVIVELLGVCVILFRLGIESVLLLISFRLLGFCIESLVVCVICVI